MLQQTVNEYPHQERIDSLQAENQALSHTIDKLKQEAEAAHRLQQKEKVELTELALELEKQETARKNERRLWKEAKEQFTKSRDAVLETRSKQVEEEKVYTASVQAAINAQDEELKGITAALGTARSRQRLLEADNMQLLEKIKALRDHLNKVGQLDSFVEQRLDGKLEQDIRELEEKITKADGDIAEYDKLVADETTQKERWEKRGKEYKGSLETYKEELAEAIKRQKIWVGKLEELEARRRPSLHSHDSGYSSYSGQAKTEDTESVASTEWKCECGISVALELVHEGGVVKSVRKSSIEYGKRGTRGKDAR